MRQIDEARLEEDPVFRYEYLAEFIGFGAEDAAAIQSFAPHIGPRIGELVERTYEKLLSYDATARHFVPRQHGYEGETPQGIAELAQSHPQIRFRKDHLNRYFMQLIGRSYDAKMVQYLDVVGKIHTPKAGNKEIDVPQVQMNAFMGMLSDMLLQFISESALDAAARLRTLQAFNKLLWIQNDFIQRHYA
ncbi:MAG: protoglobin family protein [Planctomycetaceae bacterium]|nr:protoglobin family protein [Planctomycetales bacterium]MCB9924428.1 protoglobin family protein [Planctomycetaceae bacterium]